MKATVRTEEKAIEKVQQDWKDQCQKLEEVGYSTDEMPSSPPRGDQVLLAHQYMIDTEDGREFLNDLVLGLCSGSIKKLADTRERLKEDFFEERDERFDETLEGKEDLRLQLRGCRGYGTVAFA
jgi:hypothetical protein